ncbi:MAG: anhydro-N-acetylmuramic acid kinase [Flavobacteriales bacterium]|nr:anhydro-N-acetylmuramic acid kinase [Flavobacteriales bacterium]
MGKGFKTTAIGIMSGTSLDGLDLCLAEFRFDGKWHFEIIHANCVDYDGDWRKKLATAHELSEENLQKLHANFGRFIGEHVNSFLDRNKLEKPEMVCSHGHTVFHQPEKGITLQIGDGQTIANTTGITCVNDFRSLDVSLGGQGAPLVPIGDELLFSEFDACLNLGGFSNISFKEDDERRAFDICPVNIVLNELANRLGHPFDHNGELARSGKLNEALLDQLNSLDLYTDEIRPSLAREWVESTVNPLLKDSGLSKVDIMRTFVEHVAIQIARVVERKSAGGSVLITGGGAYNSFLMERMNSYCLADLIIPDKQTIEFKEALIFAFLGVLRINDEVNVLRSVTGASRDSCSGTIHRPTI